MKYNDPSANGGAAQFNGNISEAVWKSLGSSKQSYGYTYDPVNRLKNASYYDLGNPLRSGRFNEQIDSYDANGNILGLNRKGKRDENSLAVLYGPMDALRYAYQGNQVVRVSDAAAGTTDKEGGFRDRNTTGNDYGYDVNGNMTVDKNKDIASIGYNYLNLPQKVTKTNGDYLTYTYDATGMKLTQQVFKGGVSDKKTDYSNGFIYENDVLQFFNQDEGRVVMTGAVPEYQYHLKDHLGNVRLTFTSKPETQTDVATFEPDNLAREVSAFLRNEDVRKVNAMLFNHTPNTTTYYSERLSGVANERNGLAKSIAVMPGDTVRLEVFAKYVDPASANWTAALTGLLNSIVNGTAAAGTVIDGAGYATSGAGVFPYGAFLDKSNDPGLGPKAYLNYIVFDKDFIPILTKTGFKRLSDQPREDGSNVPHEKLGHEITIDRPGYVYIYLSNDNDVPIEVYFDDFKVTQVKSPVIATNDYYPFGLQTSNSYSRENALQNNFLFNGKELQTSLSLNWFDFGARQYDPLTCRWLSPDPLAEKFYSMSPYVAMANNPVRFIDPNGMEFTEAAWAWVNRLIADINSRQQSNNDKIAEKRAELGTEGISERRTNQLNRQIGRLEANNQSLEGTRGEIASLDASSQVYDIQTDNSRNEAGSIPGMGTDIGGAGFNFSNGNFVIGMPQGGGLSMLAHELKHAYQFEIGEYSIGPEVSGANRNFLYDKHDEVAGYDRGALFGGTTYSINSLPKQYDGVATGPIDAATHPTVSGILNHPTLTQQQKGAALQRLANGTGHAFRVNGTTYYRPR